MNKETVIDNVEQYSVQQLYTYIRQGLVSLDELKSTGRLNKSVRNQIEDLLQNGNETEDWQNACAANTEAAYRKYADDYPEGEHYSEAWDKIEAIKHNINQEENEYSSGNNDEVEQEWIDLNKEDLAALIIYKNRFPTSHRKEVMNLINKLRAQSNKKPDDIVRDRLNGTLTNIISSLDDDIRSNRITDKDIIKVILDDHNIITPRKAHALKDFIDLQDLITGGINPKFIEELFKDSVEEESYLDTTVPPLYNIPEECTEIYFWGVPSSGKTCAVGAIMSTVTDNSHGISGIPDTSSQGTHFMLPLSSLFKKEEICILPSRNEVDDTFEMRFNIRDEKNREHKVAFIDMAGELYECIYYAHSKQFDKIDNGPKEKTDPKTGEQITRRRYALNILENILINNKSNNPKMHFFVIEYGTETERYSDDNLLQSDLLNNVICYLDEKGVFKTNTIGSYIILTKADKARECQFKDYLDDNYRGFCENLKSTMKRNYINTRHGESELKRFPFSIGEVCFQKWCLFDPMRTKNIVSEIKERTYNVDHSMWGRFKKKTAE